MPSLLHRRKELFPLARGVVRNSGYQYNKGWSRSIFGPFGTNSNIMSDQASDSKETLIRE